MLSLAAITSMTLQIGCMRDPGSVPWPRSTAVHATDVFLHLLAPRVFGRVPADPAAASTCGVRIGTHTHVRNHDAGCRLQIHRRRRGGGTGCGVRRVNRFSIRCGLRLRRCGRVRHPQHREHERKRRLSCCYLTDRYEIPRVQMLWSSLDLELTAKGHLPARTVSW